MKYNKLVRDKILDHIIKKGGTPVSHIADEKEYWEKLKSKLLEEFAEFAQDESAEEIADVLEVIDASIEHKGFDKAEVFRIKEEKANERGRFKDRIILDES